MTAERLSRFLLADPDILAVLTTVRQVGPKGAYVAAGFLRNRLWDSLYEPRPEGGGNDIDVVFFDRCQSDVRSERAFEATLSAAMPGHLWQVRNQARMHERAGDAPYENLNHALSHWPETATAVAVRLDGGGDAEIVAPFGVEDLMAHILRPTQAILLRDPAIFHNRIEKKQWLVRWPKLRVET